MPGARGQQVQAASLQARYAESLKLYQDKHYAEAAAILEPFYAAGPDGTGWQWNSAMYDLACEEALAGRKQKTLDVLIAWQARGGSVPADAEHHVDVPVAVLTSARTFSAAEDFVAAFNAMHRGITVGEATAGSTGQPLFFQLPGGGSARVCTRNDRGPDGAVFEGLGLRPTIFVSPTIDSVRQGKDVAMERAVAALVGVK